MNVLKHFFGHSKTESVVLIDIRADSIAGAYAYSKKEEAPMLAYTTRIPISARTDESAENAMLRALETLGDSLIREGAPILLRATGSGRSDSILVSIDGLWQKTSVRTERFEQKDPFTLLFVGDFKYFTNQDAIKFLVEKIWPQVIGRHSNVV